MTGWFKKPAAFLRKAFNGASDNLGVLAATFGVTALTVAICANDMQKIEDTMIADNVPVAMRQAIRNRAPKDQCDTLRADLIQPCENVRMVMRDQTHMMIYTRDRKDLQPAQAQSPK